MMFRAQNVSNEKLLAWLREQGTAFYVYDWIRGRGDDLKTTWNKYPTLSFKYWLLKRAEGKWGLPTLHEFIEAERVLKNMLQDHLTICSEVDIRELVQFTDNAPPDGGRK